ncbi:hypothetical protein ACQ4PT_034530 [Festuca glaucescens]
MKVTGNTPDRVKKIYIQGSQKFSTFHFDDSQGPPKDGIWFHVQGSSADGDAAASSVARETAVSFSPPPQRAPPRPSNVPIKRKERVADLGDDDDDDFVDVPPRPSVSSSKATRVAVRKGKKSKSSNAEPKHSEGVQNPSKRKNPNYRSAPNKVVEAIKSLKDPQKVKIRDYPFGPLLDLKLRGLENTKLLVFLMDRLDPDTLILDIGNGKPLKITRHSIQCVLGLPNRGKRMVAPDKHKQKEALSNLKQKLGIEAGADVKVQDLITWLQKGDTDPFSVRCFIMILLGKLLVPGTSDFITGKEAALTEDMASLHSVNWASFIFDDIAVAAKLWRSKKSCTNPSMHGCLMFLLVYYLDNLRGEHSTDPQLTPRIAHITKQQVLDLIEEDKQVVNGVETFGALLLRSQQGTCYMENTSSSTSDTPETQEADIPSASHSFPSAFFPSMHHHLACCFDGLPTEKQLAAKDALRRCDEDVGKLMLQIRSTLMMAIQEIRHMFLDGQSHTRPPPPPDCRGAANAGTAPSPIRPTHTAPNMEAPQQRQPPSSHVADDPNVLLHEGRNIEADTDFTDAISFTQIVAGNGFDKLSSSQQAAFIDGVFGDPVAQSPYDSPHEFPYDSPHEVLTNGVCKTCYEEDDMCEPDEDLPSDDGDADTLAADEATGEPINNIISSFTGDTVFCMDPGSGVCPQADAGAAGQMASPRTPHTFHPPKNIVLDPSFQCLHTESSPLPPPVYDKSPNIRRDSLTPSVDGTEHVTQSWEVSQQLRDAGIQETASWNKTPKHHGHDTENLADQQESLQFMCDRDESLLNCEELHPGQKYDSSMAVKYLSEHLNGVDPKQIKLILWTYHHRNHFSVYCVNRVNTRIDVLDSIEWSKNGGSFEERNDPWGYRSIQRLSDAFQTLLGKQFEDFSEWPIWSKEVPRQLPLGNSCASFTKKFLRHYDGEESLLRCSIEPTKENQYRAEDLSYLLFHDLNEIRPLPHSLEKFRPMLTHL